jgi:tRNA pseudouridine(55) synthase
MADGKILVLVGDECKKEEKYRGLDKEYLVDVLLGISTDTGDILGLPTLAQTIANIPSEKDVKLCIKKYIGTHEWEYPHYSSRTVDGQPLHEWSRKGLIHTIKIPKTKSTIRLISLRSIVLRSSPQLLSYIQQRIMLLHERNDAHTRAEFRQAEIAKKWSELLNALPGQAFTVIQVRCICASGTYMRTLSQKIGETLGTEAIALRITRTKIGAYRTWWLFAFWWPRW